MGHEVSPWLATSTGPPGARERPDTRACAFTDTDLVAQARAIRSNHGTVSRTSARALDRLSSLGRRRSPLVNVRTRACACGSVPDVGIFPAEQVLLTGIGSTQCGQHHLAG